MSKRWGMMQTGFRRVGAWGESVDIDVVRRGPGGNMTKQACTADMTTHHLAEPHEQQDAQDVEVQLELERQALVVALRRKLRKEGGRALQRALGGLLSGPIHQVNLQHEQMAQDLRAQAAKM